jgi:SpoVK/Ycf46/Vps4 family AAA+-type ATPase
VSYLLQRVEDFPGLIILATNFKNNIDPAFLRRFNALIYFPMPDAAERLKIWKKSLPEKIPCHSSVNLHLIAAKYELSGAAIINIMHYAALQAVSNQTFCITENDLMTGIKNELSKEDKAL